MGKDYKITEVCVSCRGSVPLQADIIDWVTWILEVKHWIVKDKLIQFHIPIYVQFNFTIHTSPGYCHVTPYICVHTEKSMRELSEKRKQNNNEQFNKPTNTNISLTLWRRIF